MTIKRLLVEDDAGDRQGFIQSVERYKHENGIDINVVECEDLETALEKLDDSFDGAVVDMKLGMEGGEGNKVLESLDRKKLRMPVVILTGTPGEADDQFVHIDIKKKGEADNIDIISDFVQIHDSGLTKVMGSRGIFEEMLSFVYKENILSQKDIWKKYGSEDPERSEKALMRHVLNHLMHMVDVDVESCVPEEFYICPPVDAIVRTGSVLRSRNGDDAFAVLTPLCDLTARADGEINARRVTLCKICSFEYCFNLLPANKKNNKARKSLLESLDKNKKGSYHALPPTDFFEGGYIDFEEIVTVPKNQMEAEFGTPILQISPAFIKDIAARFSSYFGRQGQPALSFAE